MNQRIPRERNKGLIGTLIFHVAAVVFLFFASYTPDNPEPPEEGILVNFGTDDFGSGFVEPAAASQPESSQPEESTPPPQETEATESLVTQDFEEAPEVEKQKEVADPEEERKRQEELEAEKQRQKELEEERKRKEREEEERRKKEEEQKRISEIMNRTRSALENSKNTGENASVSEGETGKEGNQGEEEGSVDSPNREGFGAGNKGITFKLAGRKPLKLPEPEYDSQADGKVVVEVTVDRNGNVISANPGVKGSTILDDYLLQVAKKAAMNATFDRKPDAPVIQKGTITYYFMLR